MHLSRTKEASQSSQHKGFPGEETCCSQTSRSSHLLSGFFQGKPVQGQRKYLVRSGAYRKLLPIWFINREDEIERVSTKIETFLKNGLNADRLNQIHEWLWMVGRPQIAHHLLCRQLMRKRTIIVTEQKDLHLTWNDSYFYIKPLPVYLLCAKFQKRLHLHGFRAL